MALSDFNITISANIDAGFKQAINTARADLEKLKTQAIHVGDVNNGKFAKTSTPQSVGNAGVTGAKNLNAELKNQAAILKKLEQLQKRYEQAGLSASQKIIDNLKRQGASVQQIAQAQELLNKTAQKRSNAGASFDLSGFTKAEAAAGRLGEKTRAAIKGLSGVAASFATIGAAMGAINAGDSFQNITNKLYAVTDNAAEIVKYRKELFSIANSTGQSVDELSGMFLALHTSQSMTAKSTEEYNKILKAVAQQLALTGTGGAQAASFILQMRQALTSGTMSASDFNSLMDASAPIMQKLATYYGVSAGELKNLASQGKITSVSLADAWLSIADSTDKAFNSGYVLTFAQSMQVLKNSIIETLGANMQGITSTLANGLRYVSENLQQIIDVSKVLLGVWFAAKAVTMTAGLIAGLKTVYTTLADVAVLVKGIKFAEMFAGAASNAQNLANVVLNFAASLDKSVIAAGKLNTALAAISSFSIGYGIGTQIYNTFDTQIQNALDKVFGPAGGALPDIKLQQQQVARIVEQRRAAGLSNSSREALPKTEPQKLPLAEASAEIENLTARTRELSAQIQAGVNADLTAWQYGIKGATEEQQAQITTLKSLTAEYENQLSVMQTLDSLQKQFDQAGMTSQQKQLDDLKRKGATDEQLAKAGSLLNGIAQKEAAAMEKTKTAADKMTVAADKMNAAKILETQPAQAVREQMPPVKVENDAAQLTTAIDGIKNIFSNFDFSKFSRGTQLDIESSLRKYFSNLEKMFNPENMNGAGKAGQTVVVNMKGALHNLSFKAMFDNPQGVKDFKNMLENVLAEMAA